MNVAQLDYDDSLDWFSITGHDNGTNIDFNNDIYFIDRGTIYDADACPMYPSDIETIAVTRILDEATK